MSLYLDILTKFINTRISEVNINDYGTIVYEVNFMSVYLDTLTQFINTRIKEVKEVAESGSDSAIKAYEDVLDHIKQIGDDPKENTTE